MNNSLKKVEHAKAQIEHSEPNMLKFSSCKTPNPERWNSTIFPQKIWGKQIRGLENRHKLTVSCSCREEIRGVYLTENGDSLGAILSLLTQTKIIPSTCCETKTKNTTSESLVFSRKSSYVQSCNVYVARRRTFAMTLPPASFYLIAKFSTNVS